MNPMKLALALIAAVIGVSIAWSLLGWAIGLAIKIAIVAAIGLAIYGLVSGAAKLGSGRGRLPYAVLVFSGQSQSFPLPHFGRSEAGERISTAASIQRMIQGLTKGASSSHSSSVWSPEVLGTVRLDGQLLAIASQTVQSQGHQ